MASVRGRVVDQLFLPQSAQMSRMTSAHSHTTGFGDSMMNPGAELLSVVENTAAKLAAISEDTSQKARVEGEWSVKQVLGHLIDSAANNHHRFVRAQLGDNLVFDGYKQEDWIRVQRYDEVAWMDLVNLWRAYNLHLAHVIEHIPDEVLTRQRSAHSLDKIAFHPVPADQSTTLLYLIQDYLDHMRDHLRQLFAAAS
jgi:uncharacterized damage-inducible protein DinB